MSRLSPSSNGLSFGPLVNRFRATGRERRNTGAGFFTELEAAPSGELIKARTLGNVWATISGFQDPTTFVLFMRDGFLSCLEGSAIRDSTVDTDFSAVLFDIVPHPNTSSP